MPLPFAGVFTALITPFREGKVDRDAFAALVERQIAAGVAGLVPNGTTGEAPTLTEGEQRDLIGWTVDIARGRVPVIGGVGGNDTAKVAHMAATVADIGAQGALASAPYYNKPTQNGLIAHYTAVAAAAPGLPVVLYDVPGRSVVRLSRDTIRSLSAVPNIVALKDATGDIGHISGLIPTLPDDFSLLSGDDGTTLPFLCVGGHGCISVLSNLDPVRTVAMVEAARAGRIDQARELHLRLTPLIEALFIQSNPLPVKAAMAALGLCLEDLRLPLVPMDAAPREILMDELRDQGLLSD